MTDKFPDPTEAKIINCLMDTILAAGFKIDVRDDYGDGNEPVEATTDKAAIQAETGATGETLFDVYDADDTARGWVLLIHGNHCDVISDYTDNETINALMKECRND